MVRTLPNLSRRLPSFQGSALERTAFEAPPRVSHAFITQEAGASGTLHPQAEPGDECDRMGNRVRVPFR